MGRWSASSPSDPYGLITAPDEAYEKRFSPRATHQLEGKESYPNFKMEIMKSACEEFMINDTQTMGATSSRVGMGDGIQPHHMFHAR